jgi:hypothetical protein
MDAPETIQPEQPQAPVIIDPQMDTNKFYEQEHERQHGISDDQPIQLAQNDVPLIPTADTHHIVQAPDGAKVAFPKGTDPDTMHTEMSKWWGPHLQKGAQAWGAVRHAANQAAQAIGLPSDQPEWQLATDEFMRDPVGKTGDVLGAVIGGLAHSFNAIIPSTPENNALIQRAQQEHAQGNNIAAATTLIPLVGDNLAKAVKQAQAKDFSGSVGTTVGTVLPFLAESLKAEGELPITREKAVPPTTTSYEHTPAQNGQFGNYEHVVTTKTAEGNIVGHLAAQDTAPGEVTIRSNQIYDEAHRGVGKGTAAIRTLVDETAKNPDLKVIHSDITTTGAARGAWEKIAEANPDTVTKQDFNGVPRWSVDLDKVREKAANAPEFNGTERRGSARGPLMSPTQIENNLKTGQPVSTPFDSTQGAMETINRDLAARLEKPTTVGTAEGAAKDTALFAQAKAKLGPDASFSDVAKEAQRLKDAAGYNDFVPQAKANLGPDAAKSNVLEEAQRLQDEAAEPLQVRHWSKQGIPLSETNPDKFGTGRAGAETKRANEPGFIPRTYFGMDGYKEPAIQSGLEHNATLDKNHYYDKDADPQGIWRKGYEQGGATAAEKAVQDAGYHGYYSPEQQVLASFKKVPVKATRVSELQDAADAYNKQAGRPPMDETKIEVDPRQQEIADAYARSKHTPNAPKVKAAYDAFKKDIDKQFNLAKSLGYTFDAKENDPYEGSGEGNETNAYALLRKDAIENKHISAWKGGAPPADHPLSELDHKTGLTYNEKLRGIHDLFGHVLPDNDFTAKGEENAWNAHRQMFSKDAEPVLATETRGQTAYNAVNGKFADQRATILPKEFRSTAEEAALADAKEMAAAHNAKSGFSFNPRAGFVQPGDKAFSVAGEYPNLDQAIAGKTVTPEQIREYVSRPDVKKALADPSNNVGGYVYNGHTILEVSKLVKDKAEAIAEGKRLNQESIFDHENQKLIDTHGTAADQTLNKAGLGNAATSLKDLWTDEKGTYTSGAFMRYLAKNKLMSKAGQEALDTASKKDFVPGWAEVSQFLTPEDRAQASKAVQKNVVDLVNKWNPEWISDAAKAGSAAKGWYSRATALIQHMFGDDAHRFTNFVASLSPQKDVEQNFTDALNFYNLWQDAGKPLGPENEKVIRDLTERAETGMSGQVARNQLYENLVNDVQPTGPKVSNFARNLKGNMDAVTKDRWMAYLFGNNERMFRWFKEGSPKPAVHLAADALIRAVGQSIGMLPAEVQETSWSFLRTVVNLTEKEKISPKEAIGRVNDQLIREGASELTRLIADSPKVQSALNRLATATGDERFRADNLQNSPRFKQLLQEHKKQPSTGGGAGAINRAGAERGIKQAIKARSEISQAKKAKEAAPAAPKVTPKKAPKDKATEFNPADMSENSAPTLTERMKNALS